MSENEEAGRSVTRPHVAQDTDLVPDGPLLKGRERPELYESHESEENLRGLYVLR